MAVRRRHHRSIRGTIPHWSTTSLLATASILLLLQHFFVVNLFFVNIKVVVNAQTDDYYCGLDWPHAADTCPHACPSGEDSECVTALGSPDFGCFYFTGCSERIKNGDFGDRFTVEPTLSPIQEGSGNNGDVATMFPTYSPTARPTPLENSAFCGGSWLEASLTCDKEDSKKYGLDTAIVCKNGDGDCTLPQKCFRGVRCGSPLEEIESELVFTLDGVLSTMAADDQDIFTETMSELLSKAFEDERWMLDSVILTEQRMGGSFDYVDLTVLLLARYRPQPDVETKNIYAILQEYIAKQSRVVIAKLKIKGMASRSSYYDQAVGIGVSVGKTIEPTEEPTEEPSGKPSTVRPTGNPTPKPTGKPTMDPTAFPSDMPSATPSRAHEQSITTLPVSSLLSLGTSTTSYGYIFNIRTTLTSPAVTLTGMEFYTAETGPVNYELWSRPGSYDGYRGTYEGWDLLASGTIQGMGRRKYTSIPEEEFTEANISGGGDDSGGTRAFYLTLNTKDLIYRDAAVSDNGVADTHPHASSAELEIYNGEAILSYPFPDPKKSYFYRAPQEFIGVIHYDRLPCRPFSMYDAVMELPCRTDGYPTESPTVTLVPTASPALTKMTERPTKAEVATQGPGASGVFDPAVPNNEINVQVSGTPTSAPIMLGTSSTATGTESPVTPLRAKFRMILRNINSDGRIMVRQEVDAFLNMITAFIEVHAGTRMVMMGIIGLWDQQIRLVDNKGDDASTSTVTQPPQQSSLTLRRQLQRQKPLGQQTVLQLTLVLQASYATLPEDMLGKMAVEIIEENEEELLERLNGLSSLYSLFRGVTGVDAQLIDDAQDIVDAQSNANITEPEKTPVDEPKDDLVEASVEPDSGGNVETKATLGIILGVFVGIFCICLSSFAFIYRRKVQMRTSYLKTKGLHLHKKDLIKNDPALDITKQSTRDIPMGGDSSSIDVDESIERRSVGEIRLKRAGMSKSFTDGAGKISEADDNGRLNRSDVITAKEREAIRKRTLSLERQSQNMKGSGGKGALSKSLSDVDWDNTKDNDTYKSDNEDNDRKKNTRNRRGLLTRSDSRIALDVSEISDDTPTIRRKSTDDLPSDGKGALRSSLKRTSNARKINLRKSTNLGNSGHLRKSLVDREFEEALLLDDGLDLEAELLRSESEWRGRPPSTVKVISSANLRASLTRATTPATQANLSSSMTSRKSNQLRTSLRRPDGVQNNLKKSIVDIEFEEAMLRDDIDMGRPNGVQNNLNMSMVDIEFEEAILRDDMDMGQTEKRGGNLRASLKADTKRAAGRRNKLRQSDSPIGTNEDALKSSMSSRNGRIRSRAALSQSMKVSSNTDYRNLLLDDERCEMPKPKSSNARKKSAALSQSMKVSSNTDYRDLLLDGERGDRSKPKSSNARKKSAALSQSMKVSSKADYRDLLLDDGRGEMSKPKSPITKKKKSAALSQSMKVSSNTDYVDLLESSLRNGHDEKKKESQRQSGKKKISRTSHGNKKSELKQSLKSDLQKSVKKKSKGKSTRKNLKADDDSSSSSSDSSSSDSSTSSSSSEDLKRRAKKKKSVTERVQSNSKSRNGSKDRRRLSQSVSKKNKDDKSNARRSTKKERGDPLEGSDREGRGDIPSSRRRRKKSDNTKQLSKSYTTSGAAREGELGPKRRARKRSSTSDIASSPMRKSGVMGDVDGIQRLVMDAREQTGDNDRSRSKRSTKKSSTLRQSVRKERHGETSQRRKTRTNSSDDHMGLDQSATSRGTNRGLSKSIKAAPKSSRRGSRDILNDDSQSSRRKNSLEIV